MSAKTKTQKYFRTKGLADTLSSMWSHCGDLSSSYGYPNQAAEIRKIMEEICWEERENNPSFEYRME